MSTITINDELYKNAERSARLSNVSLQSFLEHAISWAISKTAKEEKHVYKLKSVDELHPVVRDLIGIAKEADEKEVERRLAREDKKALENKDDKKKGK